ncbi:MAG TPA: ATP-dependent protease, partial [Candidatus Aminicenantes bacterium]|nr:ATP-dependent protease [Candidatus Aminicenantes bacterium]
MLKKIQEFKELKADELTWRLDESQIPFETSNDCSICEEIIGQERALKAIQTGLNIKSLGYNIFVTGLVGTGRSTTIKKFLEKIKEKEDIPEDILYVNNFKNPDEPTLLVLPPGQGRAFKKAMERLIEMLRVNIPELIQSKYYKEKRDSIIEAQQRKQKEILKKFEEEVSKEGFSVIQVQMGVFVKPDLIPVIEGQPTPFNKLEALVRENKFPKEKLEQLQKKYEELTEKLEDVFEQLKSLE